MAREGAGVTLGYALMILAAAQLPPAAVIGFGLALGRYDVSRNVLCLLIINVLGLDFLGSTLMLGLRGVRRRYLVLEKEIRHAVVETLMDSAADVHAVVRNGTGAPLPQTLAEVAASEVASRTGYRSRVLVEMIPFQVNSTLEEGDVGPWASHWSCAGVIWAICSRQEVC